MQYAVEECFYTIKLILTLIFDKEGNEWYVFNQGQLCHFTIIIIIFLTYSSPTGLKEYTMTLKQA